MRTTFAQANTCTDGDARRRRWTLVRGALGVAQMLGASAGVVLLANAGVTAWTLGVVIGTSVLTTVSVLLFGTKR